MSIVNSVSYMYSTFHIHVQRFIYMFNDSYIYLTIFIFMFNESYKYSTIFIYTFNDSFMYSMIFFHIWSTKYLDPVCKIQLSLFQIFTFLFSIRDQDIEKFLEKHDTVIHKYLKNPTFYLKEILHRHG